MYVRIYGRTSDRSVALEKVRGTGLESSERRRRGGGSLFSRREGRKAAVERGMVVLATAAPSRRCSMSGPAESPPGGESISLLLPRCSLHPLSSTSRLSLFHHPSSTLSRTSASLLLPSSFIHSVEMRPLAPIQSRFSLSPFRASPIGLLSPTAARRPLAPCLSHSAPISLSRRVALQKQAYGYPQ